MELSKHDHYKWISTILVSLLTAIISSVIPSIIVQYQNPKAWLISALFLFVIILGLQLLVQSKRFIRFWRKETIINWNDVCNGVLFLNDQLVKSDYIPTHIVGIGRGGAILGALISGNLLETKHIPFSSYERKYNKDGTKMRTVDLFDGVSLGEDVNLSKVLLVAGDVGTGLTAKAFTSWLNDQGAKEIRFAVLIKSPSPAKLPDYFYKTFWTEQGLSLPWMISQNYKRYIIYGSEIEKI